MKRIINKDTLTNYLKQQEEKKKETSSDVPADVPYAGYSPLDPDLYAKVGLPSPPHKSLNPKAFRNPHLWCGPKGTGTPLHTDSRDVFSLQLVGEKKWWILPVDYAQEASYLFNDRYQKKDTVWELNPDITKALPNFSVLPDIRKLVDQSSTVSLSLKTEKDEKKDVSFQVFVVTLKPFEMLYLPVYYGHAIENHGLSFMISTPDYDIPGLLSS